MIIDRDTLQEQMKENSFLNDEVLLHEENLAIQGIPHIDYTCSYEHIDR